MGSNVLHVRLTKFPEGLMAQCLDRPEILVTGKNRQEINSNLEKIMAGYVEAFPETKKDLMSDNKMPCMKFIEY